MPRTPKCAHRRPESRWALLSESRRAPLSEPRWVRLRLRRLRRPARRASLQQRRALAETIRRRWGRVARTRDTVAQLLQEAKTMREQQAKTSAARWIETGCV